MSKHLKLIMSIVAIVFSVLNIVAFFIPTIHYEGTKGNVSSMDLAFVSEETAAEKAEKAYLDGKEAASERYTTIYTIKSEYFPEKAQRAAVAGAWLHFISMLLSVAVLVFAILGLCGKTFNNFELIYKVLACAAFALMLGSMISYAVFFTTKVNGEVVSEYFKVSAGFILGLLSTMFAAVAPWLPCSKKQTTK